MDGDERPSSCKSDVNAESIDILISVLFQIVVLIVLSNVFHFVLKRLGQPSIISQLLAGVVTGELVMGRAELTNGENLDSFAMVSRMVYMFLLGIEMDLAYIWRTRHRSVVLASGGAAACAALAFFFSPTVYGALTNSHGREVTFVFLFSLLLASTSSPVLVRIATELKLANSEIGRLAIAASLIVDMACFVILAVVVALPEKNEFRSPRSLLMLSVFMVFVTASSLGIVRWIVRRMNAATRSKQHVSSTALGALLFLVILIAGGTEALGYNCMMSCFLMGLVVPREGSTARTLIDKLSYPVHTFVVPVYFGSTGMKMDMSMFFGDRWEMAMSWVVLLVLLSTLGKVVGTAAAASFLKIPVKEGIVLGLLLNVKGQVDIITISVAINRGVWNPETLVVLIVTIFLNTLFAGPAASMLVRKQRRAFRYHSQGLQGLQWLKPHQELRLLVCVHDPDKARNILSLAEMSASPTASPLAVYLLHLVQLTQKYAITRLYHQRIDEDPAGAIAADDDDVDEDGNYRGDAIRRVNTVVDAFTKETGVPVLQFTAVSSYDTMHEDVCNGAEDVKATLVLVPFHMEQRYDGKMIPRKEGRREINMMVLQHAPCTVGIFVNRRLGRVAPEHDSVPESDSSRRQASSTSILDHSAHNVVAVFFGGPDDREAVAYASRLAMHPWVAATVVRFKTKASRDASMSSSSAMGSSRENSEVAMVIRGRVDEGDGRDDDERFLSSFNRRFVATGIVAYQEKFVRNGPETVTALRSMAGTYSLFIVGKGGETQKMQMMAGLGEWDECPELGPIGDLLASHDFMDTGSVVILQQHNVSKDLGDHSRREHLSTGRRRV